MEKWREYREFLPVASTFSKDPRAFAVSDDEIAPIGLLAVGNGGYVIDEHARRFLDWVSGLGVSVFGNRHAAWEERFQAALLKLNGSYTFSLPHRLEYSVAEKLAALCAPFIKEPRVRFVKTGSDALDLAVRLCRAATGRDLVVTDGYHGWHDWYIAGQPPARGIPTCLHELVQPLEAWHGESVACFVTELKPGATLEAPAGEGLWVLDEVVTGFRYGIPGVIARDTPARYPDLICFGKALGNGLPIAAVVGRADLMNLFAEEAPVFVSSTLFGDVVALAAAQTTLETIAPWYLMKVRRVGRLLIEGEQALSREYPFYSIQGDPERSVSSAGEFTDALVRKLLEQKIIKNRPNFPTVQHTLEDVAKTLTAIRESLEWIRSHEEAARAIRAFRLFRSR